MSKTPPVPKEQRSGHSGQAGADSRGETGRDSSRDRSDINLREQGRYGNLRQNVPHHVQDR